MMNKLIRQRKWIDITVTVKSGMLHWPRDPAARIRRRQNMDKGNATNVSLISLGAHTGTHMDAPFHFIVAGKGLDAMPLNATIGKARVLAIKDRRCIRPEELMPYRIKCGERIIFKTVNSDYWETNKFIKNFVYISPEAAEYLVSRGIRTVGIDYLSVGAYHKDGAQTHRILLEAGIWIIEGLNLKGVRPGDYDLICLPLKILNSDGAPARAIIFPRLKT